MLLQVTKVTSNPRNEHPAYLEKELIGVPIRAQELQALGPCLGIQDLDGAFHLFDGQNRSGPGKLCAG